MQIMLDSEIEYYFNPARPQLSKQELSFDLETTKHKIHDLTSGMASEDEYRKYLNLNHDKFERL